ncbi:MAG TPA: DUF1439 domain-containing protein [Candidatus Aquabacterium excrementipullorum]|nr:DUF1439 domain-containing protein [Candidatus Aquabacterium excrementipullorum]
MSSQLSRRAAGRLLILGTAATLAACAGLNSMLAPSTVEISREELLKKLGQQFPMRNQIMDVFDVTANAPRLNMQPEANRVLADIDLSATDRWFKRQYQGSLWLSFGLRYEPRDQTIRLANVTIDKVSVQGLPESYQRQMTKLGSWLTEDRLQDYVVHRFTPEELKRADEHGLTVADIKITQRGLAIKLAPKS